MSTPLTDSINALTAYANEVTGASDTTLSDAVGRLCEGYGGGNDDFEVIERFSFEEDTSEYTFTHTGAGRYIFCEDPILTLQKAIDEHRPTHSLFSGSFVIYRTGSGTMLRQEVSLVYATSGVDFWGSGATLNGDYATIKIANSNSNIKFRAGVNYQILKMKI